MGWLLAFFGVWCVLEVIADGLRTYASECRNSCAIWIPASYALSLRRPRELEMQVASSRIGPFFGEGTQHPCLVARFLRCTRRAALLEGWCRELHLAISTEWTA